MKVTVEVSGAYPELAPVLAELSRLFGEQNIHVVGQGPPASWWDEARAEQFAAELTSPALAALHHIAAGAPKVTVAHVQAQMARSGLPTTPGTLSSIGFTVRRLGCPPPFTRDGYQGVYVMEPATAELLLRAIEAEQARRRLSGRQRGSTPRRRSSSRSSSRSSR